jgi:transposase InsO family protein
MTDYEIYEAMFVSDRMLHNTQAWQGSTYCSTVHSINMYDSRLILTHAICINNMPAIVKIPETTSEHQAIIAYLQSNIIPPNIQKNRVAKSNFIRRCKKFEIDENNILYVSRNNTMERRRVVPKYDEELRNLILVRFHDQANHRSYHKTYSAISEKHIGITQEEVQAYISKCSTCAINTSIKEKTDMISVISTAPWQHIQIDLIDFHEFADRNNDFSWLLTCVCTFSKFLVAVPMKNKEAVTVATHLVKDVFKILGPPVILQSDNGKEFVAEVITHICNILNIKIKHGRPRHPQAQGQIERLNQTVGRGFTKLLWDDDNHLQRKDWISIIDAFTITYNSTIHRAHGRTPHEVMVGWKMHCVYDAPDEEVNEVDDDSNNNRMSVSDAVAEDVIKQRMSRVQQLRQSVNDSLDKYRSKLCRQGSVHRKKTVNNTIEAGTSVVIAPDHDMNPKSRKRKLEPTFSQQGKFKRLTSNNRTAIVEVDGKDVATSIKRLKVVSGKERLS